MSNRTQSFSKLVLQEINSTNHQEFMSNTKALIEAMEVKADPSASEIRLLAQLCNFVEQFEILKYNIKSYIQNTDKQPGNILMDLYENTSIYGSDHLRK